MIIFLTFIAIFLIGLATYHLTKSFKLSVVLPVALYILGILYYFYTSQSHQALQQEVQLLFFFGTPMVFFASLLAPYIYVSYLSKNIDSDLNNDLNNNEDPQ